MKNKDETLNTPVACGEHCVKIKNIDVVLGNKTIIEDINLHIHCGRITAIIGQNGSGKSTLIKAILGEYKHNGSIDFTNLKIQKKVALKTGYVPQHLALDKNAPISVYDLFASYISNIPVCLGKRKAVYKKVVNSLKMFKAEDLVDKKVSDLSGGELQRVMLSIALTPMPNLLLLDEPVSGIDRKGIDLFYEIIGNLKNNYDLAMIIVSHDFDFVKEYADHVVLLDKTIIKEGPAEEVLASEEFHRIFA